MRKNTIELAGERTHEEFEAYMDRQIFGGRVPNTNGQAGGEKGWSIARCNCEIGMQNGYDSDTYIHLHGRLNYRQAQAVFELVNPWMWQDAGECRQAISEAICKITAEDFHTRVEIDSAYDGVEVFAPYSGYVSMAGEFMAAIDIYTDGNWVVTDGEVSKSYRLSVDRQVREFLESESGI